MRPYVVLWATGSVVLGVAAAFGVMASAHKQSFSRGQTPYEGTELSTSFIAMQYARAVQDGHCEEVIRLTQWMYDRLERVRLKSGDPRSVEEARRELSVRMVDRALEGNQLQPYGIEDQYIFRPGALIKETRKDSGRRDLELPVRERIWIEVIFPRKAQAPLDEGGRPIHSIEVGVNISADGRILKAGIIGNLDLDRGSISYDWTPGDGG